MMDTDDKSDKSPDESVDKSVDKSVGRQSTGAKLGESDGSSPRRTGETQPESQRSATKAENPRSAEPAGGEQAIDDLEAAWVAAGEAAEASAEQAPEDADDLEDEIDPELLKLSRPRRQRRHPLISVVVIGMSIYLMYFGWSDFRYFLQPNRPKDLGEASALIKQKNLGPTNIYAALRGAPDRKHAILLQGRVSGYESFFRLREGRNLVYVQRHRTKRGSKRTIVAEHTGRLVRFGTLSYAQSIRQYFVKRMAVAHDLDFEDLTRAKAGKAVVDKQGLTVHPDKAKLVWINVSYPREWLIQFSKKAYQTRAEAAKQLTALKLPHAAEDERSPSFWRFVVLADGDQAKQLMKLFRNPRLHAGVLRRQVSYSARWDQLRVAGDALFIDSKDETFPSRFVVADGKLVTQKTNPVRIEKQALRYITTSSKFEIPDHAVVLLAGEVPRDKWLYVLLYLILGSFIAFNLLALVRRLRGK